MGMPTSGTVQLKRSYFASDQNDMMNQQEPDEANKKKYLELGTHIASCPLPYSRTKVIKFVPRYVLINLLEIPLVFKEFQSTI